MDEDELNEAAQWRSRPVAARLLRFALLAVPFALVTFAAWQVNTALGPAASLLEAVARWSALSVISTLILISIDRGTRRVLPLSALLHLSIVFPDEAPSRFRVALRRGTTRQLAREVEALDLDDATPQQAAEYLLAIVAQLSAHDRLTRGHTERVRAYADLVADEMHLADSDRAKLHWAGLLHDIGKLTVPAEILNKAGTLNEREWARLQTHPNEGWKLVQPLRGWLGEWARATRDHHERWDGTGYPRGLRGVEISRAGRIIAVVDAFDVMTSTRAYNTPVSFDEARAELAKCAGSQFDPEVVRAFLSVSLTKPRRTGPLTWVANSPMAVQISSVAQVPVAVTSAAAAAIAASAVIAPVLDQPPEEVAERIVIEEIVPTTTEPATTTIVITTSTTTTSTTTVPESTTTAPPTTTPVVVAPTTTAATTTTTTTTTLPPSLFSGGLLGAGTGGSTFGLVSAVSGSGVLNWDPETDTAPGLTLIPHPDGLSEISASHVSAWALAVPDDLNIAGFASLRLYLAVADFETATFGGILGGLVDCSSDLTACTTIGSGSAVFSQSAFGDDFGVVTIPLGNIDHTVLAGRELLVSLAVPASVSSDLWLAFGTETYPSRFRLD